MAETRLAQRRTAKSERYVGRQSRLRAKIQQDTVGIQSHYDLPVEFFASFLGPRMAYSCAYFTEPGNSLDQAEEDKLRLTAQKLQLESGDRLLDIGCGWGSFLFYAAEEYGCSATGITLSEEQVRRVNRLAAKKGLEDRVKAELVHVYDMDYPAGAFNKVVTIGAIEHIEDLDRTFSKVRDCMTSDGLFLCHGMTRAWSRRIQDLEGDETEADRIVNKHFGVGHWKSFWEVAQALEGSGFEVLDEENITPHYALTVGRWLETLEAREGDIAGVLVPDDKYREFVALMAGHIAGFQSGITVCNQILCQPHELGKLRPERPLTREQMVLSKRETPDSREDSSRGLAAQMRQKLARRKIYGAAARPEPELIYREDCRARDARVRALFEQRLPEAIVAHREAVDLVDGIVTLKLDGDGGCTYSLDMRRGMEPQLVPGPCDEATCSLGMEAGRFIELLDAGCLSDWLDAFKARQIQYSGSLTTAIKLQGVVAEMVASQQERLPKAG